MKEVTITYDESRDVVRIKTEDAIALEVTGTLIKDIKKFHNLNVAAEVASIIAYESKLDDDTRLAIQTKLTQYIDENYPD